MANLTTWLQTNNERLIRAALEALSPDEAVRHTMQPTVASFFGSLAYAAETHSFTLLHAILITWTRSRATTIADSNAETPGLFSVVLLLKRAVWNVIRTGGRP